MKTWVEEYYLAPKGEIEIRSRKAIAVVVPSPVGRAGGPREEWHCGGEREACESLGA